MSRGVQVSRPRSRFFRANKSDQSIPSLDFIPCTGGEKRGGSRARAEGGEIGGEELENEKTRSADFGIFAFDMNLERSWVVSVPQLTTHWIKLILELVTGVKLVRGWCTSLGKKWISCLLSINIPTTATNHKTAEGPIKSSGGEASMWAVRV